MGEVDIINGNHSIDIYGRVKERMMKYAVIDTQSDGHSNTTPTTMKQFNLAQILVDELNDIGVSDVWLDEKNCIVYAKIPANTDSAHPLGLIAHMDTAPDAPGAGCKPWVLENYDGGDIVLNKEKNIVMQAADFPDLSRYIGQDLILTDGTTLLGGDDKASIAAIMTFAEIVISEPSIRHGLISIAFTPDEEVGGLAKNLDIERFGSDTAYTLDGDHLGYYMDETFYAEAAQVSFKGISVHTGTAKGKMKNAVVFASEFAQMLPNDEKPETTEGREGFYHIISIHGNVEAATVEMIIRDFDPQEMQRRKEYLTECINCINNKYGEGIATVSFTLQYKSMKEVTNKFPWLIENLKKAISACGITPQTEPFRGGTDGSSLSHRGLPCPNLSAGYENAHGRYEFVPVQSMVKNVEILMKLAEIIEK